MDADDRSSKVSALRVKVAVELVRTLAVGEVLREQSIALRLSANGKISLREILREVRLLTEREARLTHHLTHAALRQRTRLTAPSAEWLAVAARAL